MGANEYHLEREQRWNAAFDEATHQMEGNADLILQYADEDDVGRAFVQILKLANAGRCDSRSVQRIAQDLCHKAAIEHAQAMVRAA